MLKQLAGLLGILAIGSCARVDGPNADPTSKTEEQLKNGDVPAWGVMFEGTGVDPRIDATGDIGLGLARGIFTWSDAWRANPTGPLAELDAFVLAHANAHVTVLPILIKTGDDGLAGGLGPEEDPGWASFVETLAVRFGPKGQYVDASGNLAPTGTLWREHPEIVARPIRAWEIWNEPNLDEYWSGTPDEFRRLLLVSKRALRHANPSARVIFGGLSLPARRTSSFLDDVARDGGACLFDALAIHPYAGSATRVMKLIEGAHDHLKKSTIGTRDLWITEVGWAIDGPWREDEQPYVVPTEHARIARMTALSALVNERRNELGIGPLIWYAITDLTYDPQKWAAHCGFFRAGAVDHPRRAWHHVGKIAREPENRSVRLPPVRLCDWERAQDNPDERCGCRMKCEEDAVYAVEQNSCSKIAEVLCGAATAYDWSKCEGS